MVTQTTLWIPGICFAGLLASIAVSTQAEEAFVPFKDCDTCPSMVVVPAGEFEFGLDAHATMRGGAGRYMGPPRAVRIDKDFALGQTEVTNAQFAAFAAEHPSIATSSCAAWSGDKRTWGNSWKNPGLDKPLLDDEPVVCVSWLEAKAYTAWLTEKTGEQYRLPSEAEWEYAAEGGTGSDQPWGTGAEELCAHGNVLDQSALQNVELVASSGSGTRPGMAAPCDDGYPLVAPVAQFQANAFHLFDMVGNVWEWVEDCSLIPYPASVVSGQPVQVDGECELRAVRGGSWRTRVSRQSVSWRGRDPEPRSYHLFGFRVARDLH
ncbi:MAG: sulfatase activating formylglycine-generating enzyme [Halieaceae bacterium]|jgi:formylglycine-generating enzyme required for sulfatase activity